MQQLLAILTIVLALAVIISGFYGLAFVVYDAISCGFNP